MQDKRTLLFYLLFILIEFSYQGRRSDHPTRILLNEYHAFVNAAPLVIASFVRDILRTGRKHRVYLELTTQTINDIIGHGKIASDSSEQITLRRFLYTESGHDKVTSVFASLPSEAVKVWSSFPSPRSGDKSRHMLYSDGNEAHHVNVLLPNSLLRLGETSPDYLKEKDRLCKNGVNDIIELSIRLKSIQNMRKAI